MPKIDLGVKVNSVMSVKIPEFTIEKKGSAFSYGMLETTGDLDNAMVKFDAVFVDILKLAQT
jgi:vacuolar-type H+-ATPase subunit D/Vma8